MSITISRFTENYLNKTKVRKGDFDWNLYNMTEELTDEQEALRQLNALIESIATGNNTFKLATSSLDAKNNTAINLTAQSGTQYFNSDNLIKNIQGQGSVTTVSGTKELTGTSTNFLINFKRFDKIYIDKQGTISINFGAYGVPETFLINKIEDLKAK